MRIAAMAVAAATLMGCASLAIGERPQRPEADLSHVVDAAAFEERVASAGGHVGFVYGDDRPFEQCHASTIAQVGGVLVFAWFGGDREKADNVGIWYSRFADGSWSEPKVAAKIPDARSGKEAPHWNPVLFCPDGETLHLFFKVGPEIGTWQQHWMTSEDAGQTWSEPQQLVEGDEGGRGPVRCKPVVLSNGWWIAGSSTEEDGWMPFADISKDQGETWERSDDFGFDRKRTRIQGAIQPALWESEPGHVHALMRTSAGVVARSDSTDYVQTWTEVDRTTLPNNNSGIDTALLPDGRLFLIYNPVNRNWGPRTPLTLAVSEDNGRTWTNLAHLEDDPDRDSEYSYPAMIASDDGNTLLISYTWNRDKVRAWQVPVAVFE